MTKPKKLIEAPYLRTLEKRFPVIKSLIPITGSFMLIFHDLIVEWFFLGSSIWVWRTVYMIAVRSIHLCFLLQLRSFSFYFLFYRFFFSFFSFYFLFLSFFFLFTLLYDYISLKKLNLAKLTASKEAAIAWAREHRLLQINKNCGVHRKPMKLYEGAEHGIGRFRCSVSRGKCRQYAGLIHFLMKFAFL